MSPHFLISILISILILILFLILILILLPFIQVRQSAEIFTISHLETPVKLQPQAFATDHALRITPPHCFPRLFSDIFGYIRIYSAKLACFGLLLYSAPIPMPLDSRSRGASVSLLEGCHMFLQRFSLFGRSLGRAAIGVAAIIGLAFVACERNASVSHGVRLVLSSDELNPTTTFELRFDEPVIAENQVGLQAQESPLKISPKIEGRFVWLSRRSGVFTPSDPFALGKTYLFTVYQQSIQSDGRRVTARLYHKLAAPAFRVVDHFLSGGMFERGYLPEAGSTNAPAQPTFILQFNAEVDAAAAGAYLAFRNAAGQRIPAQVRQGTTDEYFGSPIATWNQRFRQTNGRSLNSPARLRQSIPEPESPSPTPVPNRLVVTPATPLRVGLGWKLVVARGLPSTENYLRLAEGLEIKIGHVRPFTLLAAEAHNGLQTGRRLRLLFSKPLAASLDATNIWDWMALIPVPTNLTANLNGASIELAGDFQLDQPYTFQARRGLPAVEQFALEQSMTNTVTFSPLPPRLYFPSFSTDQLSAGRRQLELLVLNVQEVQLRAKLLDEHTLVHALRGYQSYFKERRHGEPYHEVDYNVVAGKTIFQTNVTVGAEPVDKAKKLLLNWNQPLDASPYGAVFLEAGRLTKGEPSHPTLGAQTLIQLTDLGVVWKRSPAAWWVHVFSYTTGRPVPGATVRLLTDENETLTEALTNPQGVAELSKEEETGDWLAVEKDQDRHAVHVGSQWENQLPVYNFGLPINWDPDHFDPFKMLLFTDRSVYRPGEVAHLKGILREWRDAALAMPQDVAARLLCYDAREQLFLETNLVLSTFGSLEAAIPLPAKVRGGYRAELILTHATSTNLGSFTHYFQVQEFQPNAFEITLKSRPSYAAGELLEIPVSAHYYHGQSIAKAKLHWAVDANDSGFAPAGFEDFWFASQVALPDLELRSASYSSQGETNVTDGFKLGLDIPVNPKAPQPRRVTLLAELTDLNQQTLSQSVQFTRHSSDFYLGLRRFPEVLREGESAPIQLVAVRPEGLPYTNAVTARITCRRVEWQSVRMQGAGGAVTYRNEAEYQPVWEQDLPAMPLQRFGTKWNLAGADPAPAKASPGGRPELRFEPKSAGQYLIEARTKDAGGREVVTAMTVNVVGREELAWNYRNEWQIELTPDRTNYLAGQTALILVKTPMPGQALVTIEREQVLRSYVTNLAGNAPALQIPLGSHDAPNVFVSVLLLRGLADSPHQIKAPEYRLGYCRLNVEEPDRRLTVRVASQSSAYRPADKVTLTAEISNAARQPVSGAEVTLYAVDEGILSLTGYDMPDPYACFYAVRPLGVGTSCSLPTLLPEDPAQLHFGNKGYLIGGGGREMGQLRKNFLPCAFWQATLMTDAEGKVTGSFAAPDSLTRYRVIAVAQTARHQFGCGESSLAINKPLMVEPALPRFANLGDQLITRAMVFNQSDQPGVITVRLELDDKARLIKSPALKETDVVRAGQDVLPGLSNALPTRITKTIKLEAHTSGFVEFPVVFVATGLAKWNWLAQFEDAYAGTDGTQSTMNVGYPAPNLKEIHLGRTDKNETNLLARANPQLLEGNGTVTVRVANTRLSELAEAIAQLLHYPYGCIEQTSSSLLPWLFLQSLRTALPELQKPQPEIDAVVQGGIQRILGMQTSAGGLAYWPGGREPMVWASAYGGLALALARRAGYAVPQGSLDRLIKYLSDALRYSGELRYNEDLSDHCLALYGLALAGSPEPAYHELIYQKRHSLSCESRAMLALAIAEANGPQSMIKDLLAPQKQLPAQGDLWFGCPARELAVRLLAWCRTQPEDRQVDTLVEELMKLQREAHWTTTQGNAWAVFAFSEYATRVEQNRPEAAGTLAWGDKNAAFQLSGKVQNYETVWATAAAIAQVPLSLANPMNRRLFTQINLEARPRVSQQPRQDRGFSVKRRYDLVADDNSLHELKQARVGDRILITLSLEIPQPAHYVVVDDPWPAIIEGINPDFKSQKIRAGETLGDDWPTSFREFRADRALYFGDHVAAGSYTIRYLARVRAAGAATAPSAKVEEMYHPERFGLSGSAQVGSVAGD